MKSYRLRIEHAQIIDIQNDLKRFGKLGVIPSVQPTFATSDLDIVQTRIGNRSIGAYLWNEFLKNGVTVLPFGSDFPIEQMNPLIGMYTSVYGKRWTDGAFIHDSTQRLSRQEALKGYTIHAAHASFLESEYGSIELGKRADFVVFDLDFMDGNGSEFDYLNAKVLSTWMDGEIVYPIL